MTTEQYKNTRQRPVRQDERGVNGAFGIPPCRGAPLRRPEPWGRRGLEFLINMTRVRMPQPPPAPPSLAELRKEIDAIDEQMHRLLMQRGDIIDRLIQVKQTQEVGSAFRPAREADMMRRLVQRHRGILPLDTVESIWRVIISTFTYVQAPFSVHADVSVSDPAMRDSARFHFGFTTPYVAHFSAS